MSKKKTTNTAPVTAAKAEKASKAEKTAKVTKTKTAAGAGEAVAARKATAKKAVSAAKAEAASVDAKTRVATTTVATEATKPTPKTAGRAPKARQPVNGQEAVAIEPTPITHDEIAKLAYSYAEARGFVGGSSDEDWLRAESELRSVRGLA